MYGGDEPSTPSPPVRSQVQQQQEQQPPPQHREVLVGDELPPRRNSTRRKKTKEPSPSTSVPTVVTPKSQPNNTSPLRSTENSRSFSVTGDDIEAAFDAINDYKTSVNNDSSLTKIKEQDTPSPDSLFGLTTIKEAMDTDEFGFGTSSSKQSQQDVIDEIDFDNCFNKFKQEKQQQSQTKKTAPIVPIISPPQKPTESKSNRHLKEPKQTSPVHTDEVQTPSFSLSSSRIETTPSPTVTLSTTTKHSESMKSHLDDSNDSIDEDVDELLGKLEVSIA